MLSKTCKMFNSTALLTARIVIWLETNVYEDGCVCFQVDPRAALYRFQTSQRYVFRRTES